jgi:hypothetical protein
MQPCHVYIARYTASASQKCRFYALPCYRALECQHFHYELRTPHFMNVAFLHRNLLSEHKEIRSRLGTYSRVNAASCFLQGNFAFYLSSVCRLLQTAGYCFSEKFSVLICNIQATFFCHLQKKVAKRFAEKYSASVIPFK